MGKGHTGGSAGPSSCPHDRMFVPQGLRFDVLHSARLTFHSSIQRTKEVLQLRFWWPTFEEDTKGFVNACLICSQHKAPRRPLPVTCNLCLCHIGPGPIYHRALLTGCHCLVDSRELVLQHIFSI